ncbi:MAG TPA: hypothetical protein VIN38_15420 [Thiobacillus sp.]
MSSAKNNLIGNVRQFLAGISEQMFYYLALFAAFVAWVYFESIYAAVIVGIAGVALAWWVSTLIEGRGGKRKGKR